VVGDGRGLLSRALARLGFEVTAFDPSPIAGQIARETAAREGLRITYRTAPPEDLGTLEKDFDLAYYADTFEVTADLDRVVAQASAALRPGGALLYDTVNRTAASRITYLVGFQLLPMTRIMPRGRYAAKRLRTPRELTDTLGSHGLANQDICSFKPADPRDLVKAVLARRRGDISDDDLPGAVGFTLDTRGKPLVTYLGYAVKN
jgi:2-polyprenyl-6-hydroxyphenyl methylase / 3-demethylubiquinone-9 3-methyltransferase